MSNPHPCGQERETQHELTRSGIERTARETSGTVILQNSANPSQFNAPQLAKPLLRQAQPPTANPCPESELKLAYSCIKPRAPNRSAIVQPVVVGG
jgi:hypothetical protein